MVDWEKVQEKPDKTVKVTGQFLLELRDIKEDALKKLKENKEFQESKIHDLERGVREYIEWLRKEGY